MHDTEHKMEPEEKASRMLVPTKIIAYQIASQPPNLFMTHVYPLPPMNLLPPYTYLGT